MLRTTEEDVNSNFQMVPYAPTPASSSSFKRPSDWVIQERSRRTGGTSGRVDKYYYEQGTKKRFRSLKSVTEYLTELGSSHAVLGPQELCHKKDMQIPVRSQSSPLFKLPSDWIIEEIPRKNIKYAGIIDKYYREPGTGRRFRSLVAVERYLTEKREIMGKPAALGSGNPPTPFKSAPPRKKLCGESAHAFDFNSASPPAKVTWMLNGPAGSIWKPYVNESLVPESIKQKWLEKFVSSIYSRS